MTRHTSTCLQGEA